MAYYFKLEWVRDFEWPLINCVHGPIGIIKGDEILVINGAIVSDLDMMYIESVLQEELSLCLMLRSSRTEPPALSAALAAADAAIAQLVCPPPPADPLVLTDDALSHLIVPAPHESKPSFQSP